MADFVKLSGKDGKSAYEIWLEQGNSGTEQDFLNSLKGEKGEKGDRGLKGEHGIQGEDGKDGTSVTITKVTEINVDGGSNVVTFSDGKTLSVKNGSKGSDGTNGTNGKDGANGQDGVSPTVSVSKSGKVTTIAITDKNGTKTATINDGADGVNGKDGEDGKDGQDYILTENDKNEIAQKVIDILGGNPIFGYVDSDNNIIVSGNLSDGSYLLKYENEDGSYTDIGTLDIGEVAKDINLFEAYTPILNKRWSNSSKAWSGQNGCVGFDIPLENIKGKTMRFSGFQQTYATTAVPSWYLADDNNTAVVDAIRIYDVATNEGNNTYSWVIPSDTTATKLLVFLPIKDIMIYESDFASVSWVITK